MKDFSLIYNCKNIIKDKTCYKNPENPKCIDLIMTNHILFNIGLTRNVQMKLLSMISEIHFFNWENYLFEKLKKTVDVALKKHAPLKKRHVRANQALFINKTITKEIMKWSRLRNKFLKIK